jgi:DNA-binding MarR family transcriptional regulator
MNPHHRSGGHHAADALARTAPLISRWIERLLAAREPPLTVAQYLALRAVGEGDVVGSELARRAAVSPAATSQLLAALEHAGLLERQRLPDDRRRQPLDLTERGAQTLRSAQALLEERLAALLTSLPAPDADTLARLLTTLEPSLAGTAPPPRPHRPPPPPPPPSPRRQRPKRPRP